MLHVVVIQWTYVDVANAMQALLTGIYCPYSEVWCSSCMHMFFLVWSGFTSFLPKTLNAKAYEVMDNSRLPILWQQFGTGPFQHNTPTHKAKAIHEFFEEIVDEN